MTSGSDAYWLPGCESQESALVYTGTAEGESSISNNMLVSLNALLSGQSISTYDFKRIVFVGKQKNRALYLKSI